MVITLRNDTPVSHRYANSQLNYALVYVVITLVVLLILNIYCSKGSQKLFYQSNERSMIEKCQLAADEISALDVINSSTVSDIVVQLGSLKVSRLMVTDQVGRVIYDSYGTDVGKLALLPEIITALNCNDVFYWEYHDGAMQSHAATPLITNSSISGCVYMMEHDTAQGALIQSLQNTILRITIVLELALILFSMMFSKTFSRRLRQIMASMRIIQQGDYTHKLKLSGRDELTFLGDEFNNLTEKLHTSEQKRTRFVSDASHELKTPLASIKLLSDSILQNDMDMDTVREFVQDIGNEAERLNRTTAKLLSLTKLDSRLTDECEIINIAPTVRRVIRMLSSIAKEGDITIEANLDADSPILILEDDLYQIVFNLVENGIKYNIPGGKLYIELLRQNDNAVLRVTDTGVGIPDDAMDHIFERFYRVDKARSRATGGSGLGLAIVRAIVQRNRGQISVQTHVGSGSTFAVSFPIFDTEEDCL